MQKKNYTRQKQNVQLKVEASAQNPWNLVEQNKEVYQNKLIIKSEYIQRNNKSKIYTK